MEQIKQYMLCVIINAVGILSLLFISQATNMFHCSTTSFLVGILAGCLNMAVYRN